MLGKHKRLGSGSLASSKAVPMSLPSLGYLSRSLLVVARVLPLLVIVCLSAPAWLAWVFLSRERQEMVLEMVKTMGAWACASTLPGSEALSTAGLALPPSAAREGTPDGAVRPPHRRPPAGGGRGRRRGRA